MTWFDDFRNAKNTEDLFVAIRQSYVSMPADFSAEDLMPKYEEEIDALDDKQLTKLVLRVQQAKHLCETEYNKLTEAGDALQMQLSYLDPTAIKERLQKKLNDLHTFLGTDPTQKEREGVEAEIEKVKQELKEVPQAPTSSNQQAEIDIIKKQLARIREQASVFAENLSALTALSSVLINRKVAFDLDLPPPKTQAFEDYYKTNLDKYNEAKDKYTSSLDEKIRRLAAKASNKKIDSLIEMYDLLTEGQNYIEERLRKDNLKHLNREMIDILGLSPDSSLQTFSGLRQHLHLQIESAQEMQSLGQEPQLLDREMEANFKNFKALLNNLNDKVIQPMKTKEEAKPLYKRIKNWFSNAISFHKNSFNFMKNLHSGLSFFEKKLEKDNQKTAKKDPLSFQFRLKNL